MTVVCISSRQPWLPAQDKDSQNSSTDGEGPPNPTLGGAIGSGWLLRGVCVWGGVTPLCWEIVHTPADGHIHMCICGTLAESRKLLLTKHKGDKVRREVGCGALGGFGGQ